MGRVCAGEVGKEIMSQNANNLRNALVEEYTSYAGELRDCEIFTNYGIRVTVKIPRVENNLDIYNNYDDEDIGWDTKEMMLVPKFKEYRLILSELGQSAEENYPLEIAIPTNCHLPRDSRIILTEENAKREHVAREWRVLSTTLKQIGNTYTRLASAIPARVTELQTSELQKWIFRSGLRVVQNPDVIYAPAAIMYNKVTFSVEQAPRSKWESSSIEPYALTHRVSVRQPSLLY